MAEPRRAALIMPFFVDRDAVCNDVFHSAQALRRRDWEAAIFGVASHSEREVARPIAEIASFIRSPRDLVYFHFSTGRRDVTDAIEGLACRKFLKFHNITPPELFALWSDDWAEACRIGREDMPRVAGLGWERVLADSAFNLGEIAPYLRPGTPSSVLAPFHEVDALLALREAAQAAAPGAPHLLTVGRIAESKGHAFLLRIMRCLVHELQVPALLHIVGKLDHRLLAYLRLLEAMTHELGLGAHVRFEGEVPAHALARLYAGASAFLCTSEHEGFCVPVAEAMAFGVPVVALGTTAIPETVGDAGIVLKERDPRRFALTVQRLLAQPAEARWLGEQGRARYAARFANEVIERQLVEALGPAVPASSASLVS